MNKLHPLLQKQIGKLDIKPELISDITELLETVSKSYISFEKGKRITEHAFEVSEKEYQIVLEDLNKESVLRRESTSRVLKALGMLNSDKSELINESSDLSDVIDILEEQIKLNSSISQSLIDAKENAERAALAKSNFLSVMSHEIRTPLNAITGNIHILKEERMLPEQKEFINSLYISSQNLLNLVNDILDFNKIEDGKIIFSNKNICIADIVGNIAITNRIKGLEKENEIVALIDDGIPGVVVGDDVRLSQILNNLVSNALKFTNKGKVTIKADLISKELDKTIVRFEVTDTGVGIASNLHEKIFERFTQADSNITRQFGGSGLGLTIIKRLLDLQGSSINLESVVGEGSSFYFELSFGKASNEVNSNTNKSQDLSQGLEGVSVLLVEDVKFNIIVAKKMMEKWGITIDVAENGQIAVDKVKENTYDVILMDLQMPIMDGFTATKNIREGGSKIPIVALTASVSSETQIEVIECGMNAYLTKPFNPKDLYNILKGQVSN